MPPAGSRSSPSTVLLVAGSRPRVGKTGVVAALAHLLAETGRTSLVARLRPAAGADSEGARRDAAVFASFSLAGAREPLSLEEAKDLAAGPRKRVLVLEADGETPLAAAVAALSARVVLVLRDWSAGSLAEAAESISGCAGGVLGAVVTAVPARRLGEAAAALSGAGLRPLAVLPEDDLLFAPTVRDLAAALGAEVRCGDGQLDAVAERLVVAAIATDPIRDYLSRFANMVVFTRADKPDLALAAMSASTVGVIITGGGELLSYVLERAEGLDMPVLLVKGSTVEAVRRVEEIFGRSRFSGRRKLDRLVTLLRERTDVRELLS